MKTLLTPLIAFLVLALFFSCQSDGNNNEEELNNGYGTETVEEKPDFDPTNPPFEPERDPEVVYVDNEYIDIINGVGTFSDQIIGRTFKYHQFHIHDESVLDIHISSLHDNSLVTILNPDGAQLVRQIFGGPEADFNWNERFQPGRYTVSVSLAHDSAKEGEWTAYDLTLRLVN